MCSELAQPLHRAGLIRSWIDIRNIQQGSRVGKQNLVY